MTDDAAKLLVLIKLLLEGHLNGEHVVSPKQAEIIVQNAVNLATEMLRANIPMSIGELQS